MNLWNSILLTFLISASQFNNNSAYFKFRQFIDTWDIKSAEDYIGKLKNNQDLITLNLMEAELLFYKGEYKKSFEKFRNIKGYFPLSSYYKELMDIAENLLDYEKNSDVVETEHFKIRYDKRKDFPLAVYIGDVLEAQLKFLSSLFGFVTNNKILVEIMPDTQTFALASPLKEIEIRRTGTVGLCKYGKIMLTSPLIYSRGYHWASTAGHELVHYVEKRMYGDNIPLWLNEGVAKYFEDGWRKILKIRTEQSDYLLILKKGWSDGIFVPFEKMYPSIAKLPSGDYAGVAFAEVESFVRYFIEKFGLTSFFDLLSGIALYKGDIKKAMVEITNLKMNRIEKMWKKEMEEKIAKIPEANIPLHPEIKTENSANDEDNEIELLSKIPDYYRIGNLLYKRGYYLAASYEFKKALKTLKKEKLTLLNKLGLSLVKSGKYEEALIYFKKAFNIFPGYFTTNYRIGEILLKLGKYKEAINYLKESLYINPYHPELHKLLAKYYEKNDEKDLVKKEMAVEEYILKNILKTL